MSRTLFLVPGNLCGDRVRIARVMCDPPITQEQLAEKVCKLGLNMTGIIVSRIEKRQRHVVDGELFALSKVLGVSMEWLCNGSTEPEKLPLPGSGQPEVMLDTFDEDDHI